MAIEIMEYNQDLRFLVLGINSSFSIYNMDKADNCCDYDFSNQLEIEVSQSIFIYRLKIVGRRIFIGDIMKSLTIYEFDKDAQGH